MIEVDNPGALGITRDEVLRETKSPTKIGLFETVLDVISLRLREKVLEELKSAEFMHAMMEGPREASINPDEWDEGLLNAFRGAVPEMYRQHVDDCWPDQDIIAFTVGAYMANTLQHEYADRPGALLSAVGFTATDYEDRCKLSSGREAEIKGVIGATKEEVGHAWRHFALATDCDLGDLAKKLGLSRSTVSNYGAGKTQAKCTLDQAAVMSDECRSRIQFLQQALEVFERIK